MKTLRIQAGTNEPITNTGWNHSACLPCIDLADGSPGSLARFVAAVHALLDSVPAEHREAAVCLIEAEGTGCSYISSQAFYEREQTAEEAEAERRETQSDLDEAKAKEMAQERATFERLKKLFEP